MGVSLTKKSKKGKNQDFKRRKSNLGRGKHKQASHAKIDLQTATLRVPTQNKFQDTERETTGPTQQQLQDVLVLCHLDNDRKILSGLTSLSSILMKSSDLFLENVSAVIAATLHNMRNGEPKIREAAQSVVGWIFGRHAFSVSPFVSVFVRHVGAIVASQAPSVRLQCAFLLDKIAILPNLQPVPSLFEVFPQVVKSAPSPGVLCTYMRAITKVLMRFIRSNSDDAPGDWSDFGFPTLFPVTSTTFAHRFQPRCLLGADEAESVDDLLAALADKLDMVGGDSHGNAVSAMCSLLRIIAELQPTVDVSAFVDFVAERFPYEEAPIKENVNIARFLVRDGRTHVSISEFLGTVDRTPDVVVLCATIGAISSVPEIDACVQELCNATVCDEAAPVVSKAFLEYCMTAPKVTKKVLRALISFRKGAEFQDGLAPVISARLPGATPATSELFMMLVGSCAPLSRGFLRDFALFVSSSEELSEEVRVKCVEAVAMTSGETDMSRLLSFMMTVGHRREELREFLGPQIRRLERLAEDESRHLFAQLDLNDWRLIPAKKDA